MTISGTIKEINDQQLNQAHDGHQTTTCSYFDCATPKNRGVWGLPAMGALALHPGRRRSGRWTHLWANVRKRMDGRTTAETLKKADTCK